MSNTNQACITCAQRDSCQYYDPNRTNCVPLKVSDYGQFAGSLQTTIDWRHYRIQAAIAAMQGMIVSDAYANIEIANSYTGEKKRVKWDENKIAKAAIAHADALVEELKKGGEQ